MQKKKMNQLQFVMQSSCCCVQGNLQKDLAEQKIESLTIINKTIVN